jgi:hypothetical protein
MNAAQPDLFEPPVQAKWTRLAGKNRCGRDPAAGPGTCWHWWEGCPNPEKRNCYLAWSKQQAKVKP